MLEPHFHLFLLQQGKGRTRKKGTKRGMRAASAPSSGGKKEAILVTAQKELKSGGFFQNALLVREEGEAEALYIRRKIDFFRDGVERKGKR